MADRSFPLAVIVPKEDGLKWHSCLEDGEWLDFPDFAVCGFAATRFFAQSPVLPTGHASWVVPLVLLRARA